MKSKLTLVGTMAVACAAFQLAAMPTEKETRLAEPVVRKLLAREKAALESGKKTRAEVAVAAMKLADKADTDAKKLLLLKDAFVLYVQDGNLEKAAKALDALEVAIPDMPQQYVKNMIDAALLEASKKGNNARLNKLRNEAKNVEYKFSYKLEDEFAVLTGVEPKPVGTLVVPDEIDGYLVTRIGGYNEESPFWGCDQMTRVVLPKGLEFNSFDPGAFISCKSLSSIEISDSNYQFASLDGALYSKDFSTLCVYPKTRESIELPPETKKIRFCAFRGCALKTAKIPEGVEEIDGWNLCECPNLESIELPKSLKHLGVCAVHGSDNVKKMVFNGDAPRVDGGWQELFTGAPADLVVEVREGTNGWKSPDSAELPERWPTDQKESRPIRYME